MAELRIMHTQLSSAALRRLAQEIAASEGASEGGSHTPSLGPSAVPPPPPPRRKVREPRVEAKMVELRAMHTQLSSAALRRMAEGLVNEARVTTIEG